MEAVLCPVCKKFMRKLKDEERVVYKGSFYQGIPDSAYFETRFGCWGYCSKHGYQDP